MEAQNVLERLQGLDCPAEMIPESSLSVGSSCDCRGCDKD